jgi:hypothetical protein
MRAAGQALATIWGNKMAFEVCNAAMGRQRKNRVYLQTQEPNAKE